MRRKIFIFIVFLVTPFIFSGDLTVIVNKSNTVTAISKSDLKKIYLGKKTTWDNGNTIKVAALKKGNAHKAFLKEIVKKAPSSFTLFWKKAVFTGTGNPPKFFENEADLLKFVASEPNAIGYTEVFEDTVKEITLN